MKLMMEHIPMPTNFVCQKARPHNKTSKPFLLFVGLTGCLVLSGCTGSTYSSHFDCPMGEGAGCASISRVNKMIDRREIDLNGDDVSSVGGTPGTRTPGAQVYVYYGPNQLSRLIPTDLTEGN